MGTHHSLFLCCVFISNFISPFRCDDAYSYPRPPDRPSVSVSRVRPRINNNRCSRIPIPNGSMVLKHRGRVAKFSCNSGYKLIGDNIATCYQRKWDAIPTCVKNVQCPKEIPKVMNGRMIEYSYVYFKVICNDGYKLPDNVQSIYPCEEFFRQDVKPPVCQLSDALYCDFEKDTCGWNNTIPYFSWIRYQNATPSHELHTGPGGDHTTGTGHYLYIEASGLPDHEERYAKLTRFFKQVDTPEVCFVFWYHMYGYNIGTLDVYVDFSKVFSKSGNLGDKWRKGIVQRLPSDQDFYISVMATTANGFAGDIAIDDIGLVNSTDCTKTILVDTTCKSRCFEKELNPKLCKCSSECLIEGTCCTDFMHFCSNDAYASTVTEETTEWETSEGWQSTNDGQSSVFEDHSVAAESAVDGQGSTEYAEFTTEYDSLIGDQVTKVSDSEDEMTTELQTYTENGIVGDFSSTVLMKNSESGKLTSTEHQSYDVGNSVPSTAQGLHDVGESWSSTYQEPLDDVSKKWNSIQPELHEVGNSSPSTHQVPHFSIIEASARPFQVAASSRGSVIINVEQNHPDAGVPIGTSENVSSEEEGQSSGSVTTGKFEPRLENNQTTIDSHAEPNLMFVTHQIETTNLSIQTTTTTSTLLVTSEPPVSSLHTTELPRTPSATVSTAPTVASFEANDIPSTASHTHLLPENDYDELDESTQAGTDEPHRQTLIDLETTSTVRSTSPQKTRKPYKWKKTYEPKGRYTFSAVQSENKTTTYVSVLVGVTVFLAAVVVAAYIFRRRRAIRFHDATEESDVLYMTSDDILDFNVARRQTPPARGAVHPAQPNSGPTSPSSQQSARPCQSDFSFCAFNKS